MNELRRAGADEQPVVLATVVKITGSSYGGVGTRMVIRVDGSTVGIVSGGCLESDLAGHAREVNSTHAAKVVTYDTRSDDEAAWGLGLGCNGLIDVLLEPLDPMEAGAIAGLLAQALASAHPVVLATVTRSGGGEPDPSVGAHALLSGDAIESTGNWGDRVTLHDAATHLADALSAGRRGLSRQYGATEIAFEVVNPPIRLVICGSGPDVFPVVRIAGDLGWDVTVVDHRPVDKSHEARFPDARVVECSEASRLSDAVALIPPAAAVVMSHHFQRDTEYVRALLQSPVVYIGILGPLVRSERMLSLIRDSVPTVDRDDRLYFPVGMDIGGDGPDAIAMSIVAEVSAVVSGRGGRHLRDRRGGLHQ